MRLEQQVYDVKDLENLSASQLYMFSGPLGGPISSRPLKIEPIKMRFTDFSTQFNCLDNLYKKESPLEKKKEKEKEEKRQKELEREIIINAMNYKRSEPLKGNDFSSSGFQFHFHENNGNISGGKIKSYNGTKDDEIKLDNYQISMGDLYANLLNIKKIKPKE
ncbi:hypothetical protein M0R19_02755 [Candidatus Pacearchaeota archaeon]|jgi:hypothetical protein|nr:hypothetical protein [Candidatus Pacearchaeota archaeon]